MMFLRSKVRVVRKIQLSFQKTSNTIRKRFDSNSVYNDKYFNAKLKMLGKTSTQIIKVMVNDTKNEPINFVY